MGLLIQCTSTLHGKLFPHCASTLWRAIFPFWAKGLVATGKINTMSSLPSQLLLILQEHTCSRNVPFKLMKNSNPGCTPLTHLLEILQELLLLGYLPHLQFHGRLILHLLLDDGRVDSRRQDRRISCRVGYRYTSCQVHRGHWGYRRHTGGSLSQRNSIGWERNGHGGRMRSSRSTACDGHVRNRVGDQDAGCWKRTGYRMGGVGGGDVCCRRGRGSGR